MARKGYPTNLTNTFYKLDIGTINKYINKSLLLKL